MPLSRSTCLTSKNSGHVFCSWFCALSWCTYFYGLVTMLTKSIVCLCRRPRCFHDERATEIVCVQPKSYSNSQMGRAKHRKGESRNLRCSLRHGKEPQLNSLTGGEHSTYLYETVRRLRSLVHQVDGLSGRVCPIHWHSGRYSHEIVRVVRRLLSDRFKPDRSQERPKE